ncbi:hypothetical protein [Turneriella parva]|uniref:DUF4365 domain-containing protein n=1 Tax=Turneriella parva (strain ATCC BAA-1111 / DSM 21527 / NCTC 11395 / H) TaxID=869212 RepID=I4B9V9_TURPD|nr:hypothetical protein [Turneriella parva]AFM14066.1 hypothetical protein Turpa_3429 [Turneriella parva DSM 21527]
MKNLKQKAGHYEIQGETIAKFEFFDHGFNPYSRYLDIEKIDLILRRRQGQQVQYIEVQVKYGTLFNCGSKWEQLNFDLTSWRFFSLEEFSRPVSKDLFLAYVLSHPSGYKGDIFIFPVKVFQKLILASTRVQTKKGPKARMNISHCILDDRWYLRKQNGFTELTKETVLDVTKYRRNFGLKP